MSGRFTALGMLLVLFAPVAARGQFSSRLIGPAEFRQTGLERMWFTQLDLDRSRGRIAGLHQHVSATKAQTIYEIVHAGRRYVFSQHDRNAFGEVIGVDGAKIKADEKLAQIKGELIAAGKPETDAPPVQMRVVPEITLYATSERGLVQAIDAETGRTRWSTAIGSHRYPTTEAGANNEFVAALNGSTLYVLKADDGSLFWSRRVTGAPGAGPALTDDYLFVPMIGGVMEQYQLEDHRLTPIIFKSFGRAMVQPVASANSVAWPTDRGNLYVSYANEASMRFRMEANNRISAAPSFLGDKLFTASMDGYVYCVDEAKGSIHWRFATGDAISTTPVALGESVYAITESGTLYSIAASDGSEKWISAGIKSYLAANDERIYCADISGNIAVIDLKSGSRLATVSASRLDVKFLNQKTDRIIVGDSTGLLQCFRESRLHWPIVHEAIEPKKKAVPSLPTTPAPGTTEPAPGTAPADPFAVPPAGGDPFAPAKPAPAAAPAGDPFAAPMTPATPAPKPADADPFATP